VIPFRKPPPPKKAAEGQNRPNLEYLVVMTFAGLSAAVVYPVKYDQW
jgi:hypothetical protein